MRVVDNYEYSVVVVVNDNVYDYDGDMFLVSTMKKKKVEEGMTDRKATWQEANELLSMTFFTYSYGKIPYGNQNYSQIR